MSKNVQKPKKTKEEMELEKQQKEQLKRDFYYNTIEYSLKIMTSQSQDYKFIEFLNQKNLIKSLEEENNTLLYFQSLLYSKFDLYQICQFLDFKSFDFICQFLSEIYYYCKNLSIHSFSIYYVMCNYWLNYFIDVECFYDNIIQFNEKLNDFEKTFEEFYLNQQPLPTEIQKEYQSKLAQNEIQKQFGDNKSKYDFLMFTKNNITKNFQLLLDTLQFNNKKIDYKFDYCQNFEYFFEHKLLKFQNLFKLYLDEEMQIKDQIKEIFIQNPQKSSNTNPIQIDDIEKQVQMMNIDFEDTDIQFQNDIRKELVDLRRKILLENVNN